MGWAHGYIRKLKEGLSVQFRPRGHSMKPLIKSGQLVTVDPVGDREVEVGDIVLCKVKSREYLHLVKAKRVDQYQIGSKRGSTNGWIRKSSIFGICTKVED